MASNTSAGSDTGDLFERKATGRLRGWSEGDGVIYSTFSINLITLGLFIFSYGVFIADGWLMLAGIV